MANKSSELLQQHYIFKTQLFSKWSTSAPIWTAPWPRPSISRWWQPPVTRAGRGGGVRKIFSSQLSSSDKFKSHNSVMFWTHWLAPMFLSTCLGMSVPRCREDCMKHTKPGPKQLQKVNYYNGIISLKQSLSLPQQAGDRGCEEERFSFSSELQGLLKW